MNNRFFKIDSSSRFITAITVGQVPRDGIEFIQQTPETAHVAIGWSYAAGGFTDTSADYKPRRNS